MTFINLGQHIIHADAITWIEVTQEVQYSCTLLLLLALQYYPHAVLGQDNASFFKGLFDPKNRGGAASDQPPE